MRAVDECEDGPREGKPSPEKRSQSAAGLCIIKAPIRSDVAARSQKLRNYRYLARRPTWLSYAVEERPPAPTLLVLGLQHAGLAIMFMIYPVVVAQELGLTSAETSGLLASSLLAIAIATLLQSRQPPMGSGELAVLIPTPVMLPAMIQAGSIGGVGLIASMTFILGLLESGLARILHRLRRLLPPEVCGVVVFMLGVSLASPALIRFTGGTLEPLHRTSVDHQHLAVAGATLATMVLVAIFGRGALKLFALVFGLLVGTGLCLLLGLFEPMASERLAAASILGLPSLALPTWKFELVLLPLFALMAIVNSVDNLGVLVSIQRLNDADWKRMHLRSASGGLQANAVGNMSAGALGGSAMGVSSAHVGLSFASGATSRVIALAAGILLLLAVFMPKVVTALALIPPPVIGAIMVYTSAYMMVSGMDLILSRMLSERRIFTVGLSILLGLSVVLLPGVYDNLPPWLAPLFRSELAVAALAAIGLNLLFRIGIAQQASLPVPMQVDAYEFAQSFLGRQGDIWGARREVIGRAAHAAAETLETLREHGLAEHEIELGARFDEFNLDVVFRWRGRPLETPAERPDFDAIMDDDQSFARLAGFLIRRYADRMTQRSEGESQRLTLHFEH
ncbi:uracil-xanthine permease family protein [Aquibaculum arenosum]|uniref:Solute carrier family 23 protein n=1 Tax=Aquibaculum arenosum TaxID=3032591 RepID=A0ABT5YJH9_9PROT|nr:solute carrier family 23 protein [Fodinicurvata sp. CAU 1616]MDF2095063.1 solute carrier family 23 protein [Fodinicurvata sp. CAU 1616]